MFWTRSRRRRIIRYEVHGQLTRDKLRAGGRAHENVHRLLDLGKPLAADLVAEKHF